MSDLLQRDAISSQGEKGDKDVNPLGESGSITPRIINIIILNISFKMWIER